MDRCLKKVGIDRRLPSFIALSTIFTALTLSAFLLVSDYSGVAGLGRGVAALIVMGFLMLPFFLPQSLVVWICARALCAGLGINERPASIASGTVAGISAFVIPSIWPISFHEVSEWSPFLVVFPAMSGAAAAAIIYRHGRKADTRPSLYT